jgi:phage shock protein A
MEKALEKRLEGLGKQYTDLSESNSKLWRRVAELAKTVERMAKLESLLEIITKGGETD